MLSRFKLISFLFISLFLFSATLFWGAIQSKLIEHSVKSYCKNNLSTILLQESITYQNQLLVFENPKLVGTSDAVHLEAEELLVSYEPKFLTREIDLYITLVNPTIDLELMAPFINSYLENETFGNKFFKINAEVKIEQGKAKFLCSDEKQEAYLSATHKSNELKLALQFDSSHDDHNSLEWHLVKENTKYVTRDFSCNELCCKTFSHLLGALFPEFDQFEVEDGQLNGDITNLTAKNFEFTYKPLNICGICPLVSLDFKEKNRIQIGSKGVLLSFKPKGLELYNQLIGDCSLDLNLFDDANLMTLNFTGDAKHIVSFLPDEYKKKFENSFTEDQLVIKGNLKKFIDSKSANNFFSFEGSLDILSAEEETLVFGFELERKPFAKMSLQNGWFKASHLNLEKYLSLCLFSNDATKLNGFGDFEGAFDENKIHVACNTGDISLENEHCTLETDSICGATFVYDVKNNKNFGKVPIKNGMYFDKKSGLSLIDIQADFDIASKKISTPFIEGFCHGAYFSGALDLNIKSNLEFDLYCHVMNMKAKFSAIQAILTHLNKPYFFLQMPLDCDVHLRREGALIDFHVAGDECKCQAMIQGEVANGVIKNDKFDFSVQELNLNFDYNHQANDLSFSEIQGTLLVGKPDLVEEYLLAGDHVRFTDYNKNDSQFDLWVGDKNRDMIRIVGKTKQPANINEDLIEVELNTELSHFGSMHPASFYCLLKDWHEVHALNVELAFDLKPLLNDLQRFSRTGFFFLSRGLLRELNSLKKASGLFSVNFDFDKEKSLFNYQIRGKEIELGSYQFETALLKGSKHHHLFSIEELKLDKLSLAADVLTEENRYKINFLGLTLGDSLTVGLEGEYKPLDNKLLAQVNLCEGNFENLKEFASFKEIIEEYRLKGILKATGKLNADFGVAGSSFNADLYLNAGLSECQLKGLTFSDVDQISCRYLTDKGLVVKGIKTKAYDHNKSEIALLDIENVEYGLKNHAFSIEGVHFKLPAKNLKNMTDSLAQSFPNTFNEMALDILKNAKTEDFFEGSCSLDVSSPHYALHLALKDGSYHFLDHEHPLQNFTLDFDPCEFKISTKYGYEQHPFWLHLQSKSKNLEFGKLLLIDEHEQNESPLTVFWRKDKNQIVSIETAEGSFSGLDVQLYRNPEMQLDKGTFHLTGDVNIDAKRLNDWLPLQNLQLGSGFTLKGDWSFFDGKSFDLSDSKFDGELIGSDFEIKGYRFQNLTAGIHYQKNNILVNKFLLEDPCGTFHADEIKIKADENSRWKMILPRMCAEEFRPSLIKHVGVAEASNSKPFVVGKLELEHLEGDLLDETSWMGYGRLSFRNPHKKNLQNTILAIPAEIISAIGLNMTALTPVIGNVEYQISEGKVLLTKFKDVYSEGRLSKFYLADTPTPSFVDFDGNLSLNIRMKQNNLLFKLAEMFTFSVEGNLKKPIYSLQKQQKQTHDL